MTLDELIVKTPGVLSGRARLAGHRIPVHHVVQSWQMGEFPDAVQERFEGVELAKLYAAVAYFLANREEIQASLDEEEALVRELEEEFRQRQTASPALPEAALSR